MKVFVLLAFFWDVNTGELERADMAVFQTAEQCHAVAAYAKQFAAESLYAAEVNCIEQEVRGQ